MRFSLPNNKPSTRGFTLVEMLVIAPIVILAVGVFVGAMTSIVGSILLTRDDNSLTYNTQAALDQIEQDTRLSTGFLLTTGTLSSPQGSNSNFAGTAAFTDSSALILSQLATDKNPADTARQLVYYVNQPNACGATQSFNTILPVQIIYFIKSGSLWRRAVLPPYKTSGTVDATSVCTTPWQRNSCSPGYSAGATRCQTNDTEVMDDISSFDVKYYLDASAATDLGDANADDASTIEVTINGSKTTAGQAVTSNMVLRVDKLN
jgi:type II secretory pathway pseudopilin PulG